MSTQAAKKAKVTIGTLSNGQGHTIEITATQRGVGNAAVQQRESNLRNIRNSIHAIATKAHYTFHPGQALPKTLKKRKHYPKKPQGQHGGKKTRKMNRRRMTRRRR